MTMIGRVLNIRPRGGRSDLSILRKNQFIILDHHGWLAEPGPKAENWSGRRAVGPV